MLTITQLFLIVVSLLASSATARDGCRRCYGTLELGFADYTSKSVASDVAANALDGCATGNQYYLNPFNGEVCVQGKCMRWKITAAVYRYCGNGGKVNFQKSFSCSGAVCSTYTSLVMNCDKSVDCVGTCTADFC